MGHQVKKSLGAVLTDDGVEFCVWAPFAKSVSVLVNDSFNQSETPMASEGDGYWSTIVEIAQPGQSYKYHIETQDGQWIDKNDPRARQLTISDNGASLIVDNEFDWEDSEQPVIPKNKQIIYEMHIGTFNRPDAATSGTFETAIEKLDYLESLGINMIELMPVTSMATSNGWGYAPNHLFSVENTYGGRHGLMEFVKAAHKKGIGVIIDVVYNHFSDHTDLWQFDGWSENDRGGIYFYNDERGDTPWGGRPDYGRPEVRQFFLDNVAMWFTEFKVDGLRVDSTIYMRNTRAWNNDPECDIADAWQLFQEINTLAHKINPNALMIAEDFSINEHITKPVDQGGAGFDSQWGIVFPLAIRKALGIDDHGFDGSLADELAKAFNGDVFQKVVFSDSHDTAANGSARLNEVSAPGKATSIDARQHALVANAIALTAPGLPMVLQGEEFMQRGSFNDWHMLEWEKATQFAGIVLAQQHLINLRKNVYENAKGLTGNSVRVIHNDPSNRVIAYHRWENGGPGDDVVVIVNCGDTAFKDYSLALPLKGEWHVRFNSSWQGYSPEFKESHTARVITNDDLTVSVELSDYNVLILAQDPIEDSSNSDQ